MSRPPVRPQDATVVIARYDAILRPWADRLRGAGFRVVVCEKHPRVTALGAPFIELKVDKNRGNEASAFLAYVVDRYDTLDEHTVFLHDHERSWHHRGSIVDRVLECVGADAGYRNLNSFRLGSIRESALYPMVAEWFQTYLAPYVGDVATHGDWTVGRLGCSQMLVHRDNIRRWPKRVYSDLLQWLLETPLDDAISGRFLEWTWDLLWDDPKEVTEHRCGGPGAAPNAGT